MIDIDGGTAEEIEFKRLFLIFHALRQTLRIQGLFDGLRHQRSALLFDAGFAQLLFDRQPFLIVDMSVTFRGKNQRKNEPFGAHIQRRGVLAVVRFIAVRGPDPVLVFIPQDGARNGAPTGEQRACPILCQQLARGFIRDQQACQPA